MTMCIPITRGGEIKPGKFELEIVCEKTDEPITRTTEHGEFCEKCYLHDGHEFKPNESDNALICEICGRHVCDHPDAHYDEDWQEPFYFNEEDDVLCLKSR